MRTGSSGAGRPGGLRALARSAVLAAACLAAPLLHGEEARRTDGRRVPGSLTLGANGRLSFTPRGGRAPVPAEEFARVRFGPATPAPFRVGAGHRVRLHDGQQLTGQFLGLDKEGLALRTAWSEKVVLPRGAAAALSGLPGWRCLFEDDFAGGLEAWAVTGKPKTRGEARSVVLDEPGQALAYTPAAPLTAGRVGVNIQETAPAGGGRWQLEAHFEGEKGPRKVLVTVAGPTGRYEVEPGGLTGSLRDFCRTWSAQREVTVRGLHFLQEDSSHEIGRAIADWLASMDADGSVKER